MGMKLKREVATDYAFDMITTAEGTYPLLPRGMTEEGGLYVLPDGRYLPLGCYATGEQGGVLIYEPFALRTLGMEWADNDDEADSWDETES